LTYVVQPMRHLVLQHLDLTTAEQQRLLPALSWFGWEVPVGVQLLTVAVITAGFIGLAARMFRTAE
jgi:ABC-2 type transport system permease protein